MVVDLNLDWAKSGSWDDYQAELDRVLKQADGPGPAAAVGGPASAVAPVKPPTPGVLDQVKGWGNQAMESAGTMWNGMPTWGKGALIGGGLGALGGMLSDKRKGRGLLQGALLGGGLGAAGGYLYNQFGGGAGGTTGGGGGTGGAGGEAPKNFSQSVKDTVASTARGATSLANQAMFDSPVLAGGALAGGYALNRMGNKPVEVAGATSAPGKVSAPNTIMAAPSNNIAEMRLRSNEGGALSRTLENLAAGKPGTSTAVSPQQLEEALFKLHTYDPTKGAPRDLRASAPPAAPSRGPGLMANVKDTWQTAFRGKPSTLPASRPAPLDLTVGDKQIAATPQDLVTQYQKQLQAQHSRKLVPENVLKSRLGAQRMAGKGLMGLGLGSFANQALETYSPSKPDFASRVGNLPPTPEGIRQAAVQAQDLAPENVAAGLHRLGWSEQQVNALAQEIARLKQQGAQ